MKEFFLVVVFLIFFIFGVFSLESNSQFSQCGGTGKKLPESCHTNDSGFLCCNDGIQELINEAMDELKAERQAQGLKFNEFNLQAVANKVGTKAEGRFNATFETVVGVSNFASKTRFHGDLLCKVRTPSKKFVMSYATAKKNKGDGWVAARDDPIVGPEPFDDSFHTFTYRT